ncbi:MAG: putative response regulatory domain-containing protein [Marine Group I thaumarchaeote]|nr:MAG: putative response regulatory domain-containing protein [Marine Group I thaumarchaeote]
MTQKIMKILIVDDNKYVTSDLARFFKLQGEQYQVEIADNGAAALDKYSKFKPVVVVLDLAMPVMSGAETFDRLLKLDKDVVVIIASASDSQEDIEHYLNKGARGFISKPYSPQKLLEKIKDVLIFCKHNKELVMLFNLVTNKTKTALRDMVGADLSLVMKDVETITNNPSNVSPSSSTMRGGEKLEIEKQEPVHIEMAPENLAVVSEFEGRLDGSVISVISKEDFPALTGIEVITGIVQEKTLSFFNVINQRFVSQLADSTHFRLYSKPPRLYEKDKDGRVEGKDLTKATCEISWKGQTIPFVEYVWCNMAHLFTDGF